jgi:hypothetical protein
MDADSDALARGCQFAGVPISTARRSPRLLKRALPYVQELRDSIEII